MLRRMGQELALTVDAPRCSDSVRLLGYFCRVRQLLSTSKDEPQLHLPRTTRAIMRSPSTCPAARDELHIPGRVGMTDRLRQVAPQGSAPVAMKFEDAETFADREQACLRVDIKFGAGIGDIEIAHRPLVDAVGRCECRVVHLFSTLSRSG
jgi:hypothetical protein